MSITTDDRDARIRRFTSLLRRIGAGCPAEGFRESSERVADCLAKDRNPSREDLGAVTLMLLDYVSRHEAWRWEGPPKKKSGKTEGSKAPRESRPRGAFSDVDIEGVDDMPVMDRDKVKRLREVLGLSGGRVVIGPGGRRILVPTAGRW